ncbi:MAG: L-lactate transporter [Desulfovibrio sp.]
MQKSKIHYGWWIVAGCFIITCTTFPLIFALFNKFLIPVTKEMGVSRSSFTLANTIAQVLGIFISPYIAKKLSTGNFKRIMTIGMLGYCASFASYGLAQNIWQMYVSSLFFGVCFLLVAMIPLSMMATNWFVKKRGLAVSIIFSGIGLGGFIFSPLLTYLLTNYGWRISYFVMAGIALAATLPVCIFILQKRPEDIGMKPYGAEEESASSATSATAPEAVTLSVKESRGSLFFKILILSAITNGLINIGALGQFPPALEEMYGAAFQAKIIALYSIFGLVGKIALGWINDRFGLIPSCVAGCVTFGSAFVFMLAGGSEASMYAMSVIFGFGIAIGSVSLPLVTSAIYGPEKYGEAFGLVNAALQVGLTFGSIMVAGIFDLTGTYAPAWVLLLILTGVTLAGWIGSYLLSRPYCPGGGKSGETGRSSAGGAHSEARA